MQPMSRHTRLLEQAVSTLQLLPVKLKNQLMRLALTHGCAPRASVVPHRSVSLNWICCQSLVKQPV